METELLVLRLHNAQLAAALRAIVDRDLGYIDGFVSAGYIPMGTIRQAREVLRVTGNAGVDPSRGGRDA
jgi:hypothetical protein